MLVCCLVLGERGPGVYPSTDGGLFCVVHMCFILREYKQSREKLGNARKQQNVTASVENYTVRLLISIWGEDNDFYCDAGSA